VGLDTAGARAGVLEQMMQAMPPGATVVIAQVEEAATEVVDKIAASLGGVVVRRPYDAVAAEIEAEAEAREAAAKEARKVLRDKQREEWRDKLDHWKDEIGDKFDELKKSLSAKFKG
jgi:hypothetical protein